MATSTVKRATCSTSPNILLIVMDCVRADHLSVYGYPKRTSPHLDALAREATVYENCIAASCWTVPSQASMFTGLWPSQHGATDLGTPLAAGCRTLAEALGEADYETCAIVNSPLAGRAYGMSRGFRAFHELWEGPRRSPGAARLPLQAAGIVDAGAQATSRLIREAVDRSRGPFFLFAHYMEAHSPYLPPARFRRRFVRSWRDTVRARMTYYRYRGRRFDMPLELPDEELGALRDLYDAAICYVDATIGELVGFLERRGILDQTAIVVTADHGENIGDHGLMEHNFCLYDSLLRVPLIVRFPDGFERGQRIESVVQLPDLFPTLCELGGAERAPEERESPAADLPRRPGEGGREYAYAEYYAATEQMDMLQKRHRSFDFAVTRRDLWAVRSRAAKYVAASDGRNELYDLVGDPRETRNVIEERPEDATQLAAALSQWRSALRPRAADRHHAHDEEMAKRLRELGYM